VSYDPTQAGDPIPRKFKNVLRCVADEIITMGEAVTRGRYRSLPDGVGEGEPYWDLCFETLDAKRTDGTPLSIPTAGRLFTKEGKMQDNTQRPYRLSVAFAGLGVSIFPGDPEGKFDTFCAGIGVDPIGTNPSFDASKVVGWVFLCEMEKMEIGRDMPLPITVEPEGYLYTGRVREVAPRQDSGGVGPDGTAAPVATIHVDILTPDGAEALAQVLGIIDGQPADAELFDVLQTGGLDSRYMVDGQSAIGAALTGELLAKLQEHGSLTIVDGKIAVSTS
jgi:hypothetical protein